MSNFSAQSPMDTGYPRAVTLLVGKGFYRKRIFAGSFSTHTDCSLEHRAPAALFMLPDIHQGGRRPSHAIPTSAAKSGVRTKAIPAIQLTGNFIETSVSICRWSIWDRSRVEPGNFPALNTIGSPDAAMKNSCMTERQPKMRQHTMQFTFC